MNVLYARNEFKGVMIVCPHCHMNVRHDADDIGDAIKEGKQIVCVACDGRFVLSVTAVTENAVEPTLAPDGAFQCANCVFLAINEKICSGCNNPTRPAGKA